MPFTLAGSLKSTLLNDRHARPSADLLCKSIRRRCVLSLCVLTVFASAFRDCGAAIITEIGLPIAGSQPAGITYGPDGAYWFANFGPYANSIGRIALDGTQSNYPASLTAYIEPYGITAGTNGDLWFTAPAGNQVSNITTNGVITNFPLPGVNEGPAGITLGPDNRPWFAELYVNKIGTLDATNGLHEYPIGFPAPNTNSYPFHVAAGPDGNLWFTENISGKLGRMTTAGVTLPEFQLSTNCQPFDIIAGPDGAMWFTEANANIVGRITTDLSQTNEYVVPTAGAVPYGLVLGRDGAIWFTEFVAGQIGRLAISGTSVTITEFPIPSYAATGVAPDPEFLAAGPDGNVWFTEYAGNNIGVVSQPLLTISSATNSQVAISWTRHWRWFPATGEFGPHDQQLGQCRHSAGSQRHHQCGHLLQQCAFHQFLPPGAVIAAHEKALGAHHFSDGVH